MSDEFCTILLIDDSAEDCRTVRDLLPVGYDFDEAPTWEQGLARLRTATFDCVLLDQNLPDASGLDALLEIGHVFGKSAPPVVLLTGSRVDEIGPRALQYGAQDFLSQGRDQRRFPATHHSSFARTASAGACEA